MSWTVMGWCCNLIIAGLATMLCLLCKGRQQEWHIRAQQATRCLRLYAIPMLIASRMLRSRSRMMLQVAALMKRYLQKFPMDGLGAIVRNFKKLPLKSKAALAKVLQPPQYLSDGKIPGAHHQIVSPMMQQAVLGLDALWWW